MKAVKYLGFLLGVVATLAVALVLFVSLTFDAARVKSEFARLVKDQTQRTLEIEGDLELAFWPSVGVKAGRTRLSERGSDEEFASLDRAHVSLSLLPLLRREVVVDRLEVEGAKVAVLRRADGSFNFDDLAGKEQKPEQDDGPARLAVSGISLSRSSLVFEDQQARRTLTLDRLELRTGQLGPSATGRLDFSGDIGVDSPKLQARIELSGEYRLDIAQASYALSGLSGRASGDFPELGRSELTLGAQLLHSDPKAARVEGLRLAARGQPGGEDMSVEVAAPRLELAGGAAASDAVKASLELGGAQRAAKLTLNAAGVAGNPRKFRVARLAVDIDAARGAGAVKGALAAALDADMDAGKLDVTQLEGRLGLSGDALGGRTVDVSLAGAIKANLEKRGASGELTAKFDETTARLKFSADRAAPLVASFDLEADRINADRYGSPKSEGARPADEKPAPEARVDLSGLKGPTVTGRVRVGELQVANVKATDVRAELRLRDGRLDVRPVSAALYGGSLAGSLSAVAAGNEIATRQLLTNISIGPLVRDLAGHDNLEGRGNVFLDVRSAGATIQAMKRALSGNARFNLRDGAIKGINLAQTFRALKTQVGRGGSEVRQASRTEKTDFTELGASFVIRDGIARNSDLMGKSPLLRLAGAGQIDVGAGTVDYLAKATVVATSTGQEGKELESLRGVTVPVRVTGPYDQLSYAVDVAGLAAEAAKAQAARALDQAVGQKGPEQLLQEGLKGLFK